jgi:hypothetical protein
MTTTIEVVETSTERARRRLELERVLKTPDSVYKNAYHFVDLALRHHWRVVRCYDGRFAATAKTRTIFVPRPIDGDEAYAMALHEGGHVEDPDDSTRPFYREHVDGWTLKLSMEAEIEAWSRALFFAGHRWQARMNQCMESSLWSYRSYLHMYPEWRKQMEDLLATGRTQACHVVRMIR